MTYERCLPLLNLNILASPWVVGLSLSVLSLLEGSGICIKSWAFLRAISSNMEAEVIYLEKIVIENDGCSLHVLIHPAEYALTQHIHHVGLLGDCRDYTHAGHFAR